MPSCFICKESVPLISILCKHFQIKHATHDFCQYICVESDCNRSFHLLNSFKKHLSTHIINPSTTTTNKLNINSVDKPLPSISSENNFHSFYTINENPHTSNTDNCNDFRLTDIHIGKFLASMYSNSQIPRNVIQLVIEGMIDIINGIKSSLLNNDLIIPHNISNHINSVFKNIDNTFLNLNTEYKRIKYYTEKGTFIPPQEYVVGEKLNDNRNHNTFSIIPTNCTAQFISTRHILKKFFEIKNILSDTFDYINEIKSCDNILMNFIQGSLWKNKIKEHDINDIVLPIFLFFDDYEVGNPLGSHSSIHKLGAVYLTVPCIPSYRQASLNNIFLTLLFHSSDRKKFGNNIIFRPLINELNYLKQTGIEVNTDKFKGIIKFELGVILGDNLGIHSITGFVESFSSNYPCRMCKIKKEEMKKQCYVDIHLLRNWEQYNLDLIEGDVINSGIKEACIWHDIPNFRVVDQVGVDIMHDLLEGVCKYDMTFLILYYINDLKIFSLEVLNNRMIHFDYGPDKGSKPTVLNAEYIKKHNIRLSASEMMTFVRYFGLFIGDFVPRNDPVWNLYILLRQILDLLISGSLQKGCSEYLQTLIAEHHDLYLKYSNLDLKPKFHFMLHYHTLLNKFGPLISLWSMRFEAKHRISKISANTSSNRRNICKTLAIKHQLQLNYMFLKNTLNDEIELGPSVLINDIEVEEIQKYMQIQSIDLIIKCPWVSVKGTKYKPKTVLTLNIHENELPTFCIIEHIYVYNNEVVLFKCLELNTIMFDEHIYSYEVKIENDNKIFVYHHMLPSFIPNNLSILPNGCKYVTLRSST